VTGVQVLERFTDTAVARLRLVLLALQGCQDNSGPIKSLRKLTI